MSEYTQKENNDEIKYIFQNPSSSGPNFKFNTGNVVSGIEQFNSVLPNISGSYSYDWDLTQWGAGQYFDPSSPDLSGVLFQDTTLGNPIAVWTQGSALSSKGSSSFVVYSATEQTEASSDTTHLEGYTYRFQVQGGDLNDVFIQTSKNIGTSVTFDHQVTFSANERVLNVTGSSGLVSFGNNFTIGFNMVKRISNAPQMEFFLQSVVYDSRGESILQAGYSTLNGAASSGMIFNIGDLGALSTTSSSKLYGYNSTEDFLSTTSTDNFSYVSIDLTAAVEQVIRVLSAQDPSHAVYYQDLSNWNLGSSYIGGESGNLGNASLSNVSASFDVNNVSITEDENSTLTYDPSSKKIQSVSGILQEDKHSYTTTPSDGSSNLLLDAGGSASNVQTVYSYGADILTVQSGTIADIHALGATLTLVQQGGGATVDGNATVTLTGDGTVNIGAIEGTIYDDMSSGVTLSGQSEKIILEEYAGINIISGSSSEIDMNNNSYLSQEGGNSNIVFGNSSSSASIDLSASQSTISGFDSTTSTILLTGVDSVKNVKILYNDQQAIITEYQKSGELSFNNSVGYGISVSTDSDSGTIKVETTKDTNDVPAYRSGNDFQSIEVENSSLSAILSGSYTQIIEDMSADSYVDLAGFNTQNGMILLTHLHNISDVQISYENGNAIIAESGNSGKLLIENTDNVSLITNVGNIDFSQLEGSITLAVLSTPTPPLTSAKAAPITTVDNGESKIFSADSGKYSIVMSGGNLFATLNNHSYTTLKEDFSAVSHAIVEDFTTSNGMILATQLTSFNDLSVYYGDGNAVISGSNGSVTLLNIQVGSVGLLSDVGSVNFSDLVGSRSLAIIGTASDNGAITITSDATYNAAASTSHLLHVESGTLTADLVDSAYSTIDIDMTQKANLILNNFSPKNGEILLTGVNSSDDLQVSYHDHNTYISSSSGASVIMTGHDNVSFLSSVGNVIFSDMTGHSTLAVI
ncbi:hypothetical protein AA103196_0975 [Ameyamaea chiangmaiensis NBRC 103196]|uniref:Uncharacterized protein n=1 Tax=Ameyamaea chiangmaiensis TaxID=442969 RepID=A0A850PA98_9PROT|nr:hypothetical protein [Ameyamaea chiangmaiensis]MBS4076630.1 hypothetical protein [Ameyamaea chiangmaiensis]NVN40964.1 hypothetical protein [Ameyamaea chiangmaiensis]GBQ64796.1 hypothetical protein AA103196_0975 [Ameyamaea chiangmaiensis NBRC 103196]